MKKKNIFTLYRCFPRTGTLFFYDSAELPYFNIFKFEHYLRLDTWVSAPLPHAVRNVFGMATIVHTHNCYRTYETRVCVRNLSRELTCANRLWRVYDFRIKLEPKHICSSRMRAHYYNNTPITCTTAGTHYTRRCSI